MTELFHTVHGSHLYGLSHEGSDLDTYRVISGFGGVRPHRVRHSVNKAQGTDVTTIGLSTFLHQCEEGVPQALEAMFSELATTDVLRDYRRSYRVNPDKVRRTYKRTAKNFMLSDSPKKHKHALRLLINLQSALDTGRFDPTLSGGELRELDLVFRHEVQGQYYDMMMRML